MANDVKALPVVAYGYANTRPTERHSLMMVRLDNCGDQYPELALPLVLRSDAESALAELRAEVRQAQIVCDSYAEENQRLFDRADTAEARLDEARRAIADLLLYFKSGNSIPVEKATIKADSPEIVTLAAFLGERK